MENNIRAVEHGDELHEGARALSRRSVDMAELFLSGLHRELKLVPRGRKAHPLREHESR